MSQATKSVHEARARYLSVEEGFNIKRLCVEPYMFADEREHAFDPATPTGFVTPIAGLWALPLHDVVNR